MTTARHAAREAALKEHIRSMPKTVETMIVATHGQSKMPAFEGETGASS